MLRTRGKRKIKPVIKMWNECICEALEIRVTMGYSSNCAEREGTESAHAGNVTELVAVRGGMSFLVVNKSTLEMRCMKARKRKGGAQQAVTAQCKPLNGDMMHKNLHSLGTVQAAFML